MGTWVSVPLAELPESAEAATAYKLPESAEILIRQNVAALASTAAADGQTASVQLPALTPWSMLVRQSQSGTCFGDGPHSRWAGLLRVLSPLALVRAPKPSLTRDEHGQVCVFTGTGKDVSRSTQLFLPTHGQEIVVDVHHVAQKLQKLGDLGDAMATEDKRQTREAILVLLDTSNSMGSASDFRRDRNDSDDSIARAKRAREVGWDYTSPEDDSPERVQELLEQFGQHPNLLELCELCQWTAERHACCNQFAREGMVEAKARDVLQEFCRLERLKPHADPDICRIYTHHQDDFVRLLCKQQHRPYSIADSVNITGKWRVETKHESKPQSKRQRKHQRRHQNRRQIMVPTGTYELDLHQSGSHITGMVKGWSIDGTVENQTFSFSLLR